MKGAEHIRYSGSLMKYSFGEQQEKVVIEVIARLKAEGM
ncbi:exonuclease SbcD [Vibrio cholerae]|nr:exonuclease SbcD [Vibrio cholerae]